MIKKTGLLCVVLVLALGLSGCCNEQECSDKYDLSKCTQEECNQRYPIPQPPDGPDVVLGPGGGISLNWTINQVGATDGGTVLDKTNPATYCKLREDFIGDVIYHFKYMPEQTSSKQFAEEIYLVSGNIQLTIKRSSSGGLDWRIKDTSTGAFCTLKAGPIPATFTDVPSEFFGLTHGQTGDVFNEVYKKKTAEEIDFKVQY